MKEAKRNGRDLFDGMGGGDDDLIKGFDPFDSEGIGSESLGNWRVNAEFGPMIEVGQLEWFDGAVAGDFNGEGNGIADGDHIGADAHGEGKVTDGAVEVGGAPFRGEGCDIEDDGLAGEEDLAGLKGSAKEIGSSTFDGEIHGEIGGAEGEVTAAGGADIGFEGDEAVFHTAEKRFADWMLVDAAEGKAFLLELGYIPKRTMAGIESDLDGKHFADEKVGPGYQETQEGIPFLWSNDFRREHVQLDGFGDEFLSGNANADGRDGVLTGCGRLHGVEVREGGGPLPVDEADTVALARGAELQAGDWSGSGGDGRLGIFDYERQGGLFVGEDEGGVEVGLKRCGVKSAEPGNGQRCERDKEQAPGRAVVWWSWPAEQAKEECGGAVHPSYQSLRLRDGGDAGGGAKIMGRSSCCAASRS